MTQLPLWHGKPRALDAFCCSGGATRGYQLAGFHVIGVDIAPQPRYCGDAFIQGDAIEFIRQYGHGFDFIHASPPCQHYTPLNAYNHKNYPDLIAPTREALIATGVPYVIENVPQAPLQDPVMLCGAMFGLPMYRHRNFEAGNGLVLDQPAHPKHVERCTRNGYLPTPEKPFMSIHGGAHSRAWQKAACEAMGTPWLVATDDIKLGIREVSEAIPPAYARFIGDAVMRLLAAEQAPVRGAA